MGGCRGLRAPDPTLATCGCSPAHTLGSLQIWCPLFGKNDEVRRDLGISPKEPRVRADQQQRELPLGTGRALSAAATLSLRVRRGHHLSPVLPVAPASGSTPKHPAPTDLSTSDASGRRGSPHPPPQPAPSRLTEQPPQPDRGSRAPSRGSPSCLWDTCPPGSPQAKSPQSALPPPTQGSTVPLPQVRAPPCQPRGEGG